MYYAEDLGYPDGTPVEMNCAEMYNENARDSNLNCAYTNDSHTEWVCHSKKLERLANDLQMRKRR